MSNCTGKKKCRQLNELVVRDRLKKGCKNTEAPSDNLALGNTNAGKDLGAARSGYSPTLATLSAWVLLHYE